MYNFEFVKPASIAEATAALASDGAQALSDSRSLRRAALLHKVPYYTTLAGSIAATPSARSPAQADARSSVQTVIPRRMRIIVTPSH